MHTLPIVLPEPLLTASDSDFRQWLRQVILVWQQQQVSSFNTHPLTQMPVRFSSDLSLAFAGEDVTRIQAIGDENEVLLYKVSVAFIGLAGKTGLLPAHYTAQLRQLMREQDFALTDFLDIFHHRSVCLFYQAWEKYRYPIPLERYLQKPVAKVHEPLGQLLSRLAGISSETVAQSIALTEEMMRYYTSFFINSHGSAAGLQQLLRQVLAINVKVLTFQTMWLKLQPDELSKLSPSQSSYNCLGSSLVVGKAVWTGQHKIYIKIELTTWQALVNFLPGNKYYNTICQLTSIYLPAHLSFDVQLALPLSSIPTWQLGHNCEARLGWGLCLVTDTPCTKTFLFAGQRC